MIFLIYKRVGHRFELLTRLVPSTSTSPHRCRRLQLSFPKGVKCVCTCVCDGRCSTVVGGAHGGVASCRVTLSFVVDGHTRLPCGDTWHRNCIIPTAVGESR